MLPTAPPPQDPTKPKPDLAYLTSTTPSDRAVLISTAGTYLSGPAWQLELFHAICDAALTIDATIARPVNDRPHHGRALFDEALLAALQGFFMATTKDYNMKFAAQCIARAYCYRRRRGGGEREVSVFLEVGDVEMAGLFEEEVKLSGGIEEPEVREMVEMKEESGGGDEAGSSRRDIVSPRIPSGDLR
ncbi:hypothetical protein BJ508DRAFT_183061 [Ascobolus immersus RN42]|uniref:Uncharacterized protein n=1 Tax=Ascobolus immersus RN42 TaxID=1160509 RepID=A0A3N4I3Q5_ASCIM|nr:hypothetical protein BJ508DRAFT_183061 [Ascobolus immersus RN42]